MYRCLLAGALGLLLSGQPACADRPDPYFGEALYQAFQGDYFSALQTLDSEMLQHSDVDEPKLDSLYRHLDQANFSLGDFELRYRMHHRAGRAITRVLEGAVDESVRNDAAFRLARIHFQKNQVEEAQRALERIDGAIPEAIADDVRYLRANVKLALGQPADAIDLYRGLQDSRDYAAYAAYNLAIAYRADGKHDAAQAQLARAGQVRSSDPGQLAIRDKANLVLGSMLFNADQFADAAMYFDRVRLAGPFSNQALLKSGWAHLAAERHQRAVVPLDLLTQREVTDAATQEGMLALPYAFSQMQVYGRAAQYYSKALDTFGVEIDRLNRSIDSIREGNFLRALVRAEVRHDQDWVVTLRELPDTPETFYLSDLLASHEFQTGLQNYLDLSDLRRRLQRWQTDLESYAELTETRRAHYEPLLPDVDDEFRELDSRLRLRQQQHRILVRRRDELLTMPRPEFLATPQEQQAAARLADIESRLAVMEDPRVAGLLDRARRLRGVITWSVTTDYHHRLTEFDRNLRRLQDAMTVVEERYAAYVRSRQAATHSYAGYDKHLRIKQQQVATALERINSLMKRQGRLMELVAIDQLSARRGRLQDYREQARFALADSYDRATQAQARVGRE